MRGPGAALGLTAVLLVAAGVGCGDLKDLFVLQQGLAGEFHSSTINVNLSSTRLTVIFQNSRVADLPEADRAMVARRVAEYVRGHYPAEKRLESIDVGFTSVRGGGGFSISTSNVPYRFAASDLGAAQPAEDTRVSKATQVP